MIYLILSIVLTSWLTLSFKVVERLGLNTFHCIVFNYIFCVITGCVVSSDLPRYATNVHEGWFLWAFLMGSVFISLFNIIGFTAQKLGVAVTSVANKLSLVIPFMFSIYLYSEAVSFWKIAGILLALLAVVFTSLRPKVARSNKKLTWLFILPIVLFIGSGFLDTMIKYVEGKYIDETNRDAYLITAFSFAAAWGLIGIFAGMFRNQRISWKAVVAGAAIGIPNYFSIWFLLQVLKVYPKNSSAIIPINNMGIVLFSAVMAWLLFRERLSLINWLGIVLSIGAISLIAYG